MNITLSSDPETIAKTREFARRQGLSLNEFLRLNYMQSLGSHEDSESVVEEFTRNARIDGGESEKTFRFDREEAHGR
jgi:hypothetical protein